MTARPVGVAVVGCGTISTQYLDNLTAFPDIRVVACTDLDPSRARQAAERYHIPVVGDTDQVLGHPDVEIVVNLTIPAVHTEVAHAAIAAGKHVYSEKPLALERDAGAALLAAASTAGVRVANAPDTFLGAGLQTAYRMIAEGAIGTPLTALTLMQSPGPESWHPNPAFLFQYGAGPLFDIGPYYLTTLVGAFGPARSVAAVGRRARDSRVVGSGPLAGTAFDVEVPTHVAALLDFTGGQAATSVLSFDSPLARAGFVEITGSEATMALPDPNTFTGTIRLRRAGDDDWSAVPAKGPDTGRGLGVLDLARAVRAGTPHRASGELALHVLELMTAIAASAETGAFVPIGSSCAAPALLPDDFDPYTATL
ncbi:oxidoreductase [Actinocatenispora thailandica]|uniref:Oxidoreductase n=1 Tax=Actinocatenispora thailandica TaxID=227318 RepID=A0A7R7HW34_9ACTN|nr:Gfo/Idh/MocA family oxidoreductase [Actinocatenispora thailandica]BCJ33728.1 oxidoreductase [Actinocatenispora thailandica]